MDEIQAKREVFTVTDVTAAIKILLNSSFRNIWVAGEISGMKLATSGHLYFTLKDASSQLKCACFRVSARLLKFRPADGMAVIARGSIDVYEPRGEYQFLVEWIEPQGFGALQLAFEQLKRKLEAEGLFAAARKRALPRFPRRIGIVTSPTGAAIRDMLNVLERRFPGLHIRLYPAQVQGAGSLEAVVEGIEYFARTGWADVVIVGRGGGSLEDLWTFNEEAVARAIAACSVPVISAVGHETDFTIADFVADLRAPTPSAAAELAIAPKAAFAEQVENARGRMERAMRLKLANARNQAGQRGIERARMLLSRRLGRYAQDVDDFDYRVKDAILTRLQLGRRKLETVEARLRRQDLRIRLAEAGRRLEGAAQRAASAMRMRLERQRGRLARARAALDQLSPLAILKRGYAIVQKPDGTIVREAAQVGPGQAIEARLHRGRLRATVEGNDP